MKNILSIKNLYKSFGDFKILQGVNLDIKQGEITVILGKSGTGKSVLLKNIIGILKPDKGEILYNNEDLTKFSQKKLLETRKNFGYLFQDAALFDFMTVGENIEFPLIEMLNIKSPQKRKLKIKELLNIIGLPGIENKYPSELSGGMRKRVGLARALAVEPKIILFDEPTTGLDPLLAASIDELTVKINKEMGVTCIVISHDISAAFRIAHTIAFLYEGKIEFYGTPTKALEFNHPILQQFIKTTFSSRDIFLKR
jgi:phospholipid/cholesterol/gamma-HCH transport system ATP-binding protein